MIEALREARLNVLAEGDGREGSWGERVWYPADGDADEFDTIDRRIAITQADLFSELAKAGCAETTLREVPDPTLAAAVRTLFAGEQPLPALIQGAVDEAVRDAHARLEGR